MDVSHRRHLSFHEQPFVSSRYHNCQRACVHGFFSLFHEVQRMFYRIFADSRRRTSQLVFLILDQSHRRCILHNVCSMNLQNLSIVQWRSSLADRRLHCQAMWNLFDTMDKPRDHLAVCPCWTLWYTSDSTCGHMVEFWDCCMFPCKLNILWSCSVACWYHGT